MKESTKRKHLNVNHSKMQYVQVQFDVKTSSVLHNEQNTKLSNPQRSLRSSGSYLEKQKKMIHQHYRQLNKSADISYFIHNEKGALNKTQESTENSSYAYIGQIQALQRKKLGRKSFYKQTKMEKSPEQRYQNIFKQQKMDDLKNLNDIVIKDLKSNLSINEKKTTREVQVEELHYKMVMTQQKLKKKCQH